MTTGLRRGGKSAALHACKWRGIGVTLFVNWAVKPFSMALLGWIFIRHVFAPYLPAEQLDSYVAGLILLAAAPCTAMVFLWSRLTNGHPLFTLSQVALNDTIMVFAFAPLVALLLGLSAITVPWDTLITSVVLYIVIPVVLAHSGAGRCWLAAKTHSMPRWRESAPGQSPRCWLHWSFSSHSRVSRSSSSPW
jgi:ACR3 family arsenite efflux pump ArsB